MTKAGKSPDLSTFDRYESHRGGRSEPLIFEFRLTRLKCASNNPWIGSHYEGNKWQICAKILLCCAVLFGRTVEKVAWKKVAIGREIDIFNRILQTILRKGENFTIMSPNLSHMPERQRRIQPALASSLAHLLTLVNPKLGCRSAIGWWLCFPRSFHTAKEGKPRFIDSACKQGCTRNRASNCFLLVI